MVDRHLAEQRLASIADHLARIRSKLPATRAEFLVDRDAQEAVAFNLFLAFQDALDLAAHIIADRGWPVPTTNREHFDVLARNGALTPATAASMANCAGLRNLIAHSHELPAGLDALESLSAEIAATV